MFQASSDLAEIPPVGEGGAVDWISEGGEVANPLSYWAEDHPDSPEYPIVIFDGGITASSDPMPITQSLFVDCLEIDVAASHLLGTSQDAARGTLAIIRDAKAGAGQPLPRTTFGVLDLQPGQDAKDVSHGAQESIAAFDVLDREMIAIASGYNVPDYMVKAQESSSEVYSGVALEIKTRPLIRERSKRVNKNAPAVKKLFDIEKALIGLYYEGDDATVNLLQECTQNWDPGQIKIPENKNEAATRLKTLKELGIMDPLLLIQEYFNFASEAEAIELYEKMKERKTQFPPLVEPEKPPRNFGLKNRKV
jgi:hypothetical protein